MRKIRISDNQETGYDERHPKRDKLWKSDEVKKYIASRHFPTPAERTQAKKARNKRNYQARKAKYDEIKAKTKEELAAGTITQSEADERLNKYAVGWYKTVRDLQAKINKAEAGSAAKGEVEAQLQMMIESNEELAQQFQSQCQLIFDLFVKEPQNPRPPACLQWPEEASLDAYLRIVALTLPMTLWPNDPFMDIVRKTVVKHLHPDNVGGGEYLGNNDREVITARFNASVDKLIEAKKEWSINKLEQAQWLQRWIKLRMEIQEGFLPTTDKVSPFVWKQLLEDSFEMVKSRNAAD